jgi:HEAT repeat protein
MISGRTQRRVEAGRVAVRSSVLVLFAFFVGLAPASGRRGGSGSRRRKSRAYQRRLRKLKRELEERRRRQMAEDQKQLSESLRKMGLRPGGDISAQKAARKRNMEALRSRSADERADAAWWLGTREVKAAHRRLSRLLRDENARVRANAIYALGRIGANHLASRIFDMLERDDSVDVRGRAAETLGRFGYSRALPLLLGLLEAKDARLRMGALAGLGWMDAPSTFRAVRRLCRDDDPLVRAKAALALARMGNERGVTALTRLLKDQNAQVVEAAVVGLVRLGARTEHKKIEVLLAHSSEEVKRAAASALVSLRSVKSLPALEELASTGKGIVAAEALTGVARLGGEVDVGLLRPLLTSPDNRVRLEAIRAASVGGCRWAIPIINSYLDGSSRRLEVASIRALGELEAYSTSSKLVDMLKDSKGMTRVAIIDSLGLLGGPRALPACAILLRDRNPKVAAAAAECVARQADRDWELAQQTGRELARMLRLDADAGVAAAVARALASVGIKKNRKGYLRLVRLTLHRDPACRKEAAESLGRVSGRNRRESEPSISRLLRRDDVAEVRLAAAIAAGRLGFRSLISDIDQLHQRQATDAQRFRTALALSLFAERFRKEAGRLFLSVTNTKPNLEDKVELVRLMGSFPSPWARSLLKQALGSPNALVRAEARRQLGVVPPPPKPLTLAARPDEGTKKTKPMDAGPPRSRQDAEVFSGPFPLPAQQDLDGGGCTGCGCCAGSAGGGKARWSWLLVIVVLCLPLGRRYRSSTIRGPAKSFSSSSDHRS